MEMAKGFNVQTKLCSKMIKQENELIHDKNEWRIGTGDWKLLNRFCQLSE